MSRNNKLHYKKKEFYRRNLPHYQNSGGLFFVTYNVKSALKISEIKLLNNWFDKRIELLPFEKKIKYSDELDEEYRRYFGKYDKMLHTGKRNCWLKNTECAKIVADSLHFWDNIRIELYAYCVMPNHVHTVFKVFEKDENGKKLYLQDITESVKKFSARECNKILGRKGQFWQNESYDRLVRSQDELFRIISYILDNPVKAGLCKNRKDWEFSYIKETYNEFI